MVVSTGSYETRSCDVLKELHWQPLKERFEHKKLFFMHKIRNNEFPNSILNMFNLKTNSRYNLRRNNRDFIFDKPNTNFMKKSISYAAPSAWNNLGAEISSQKFESIFDHYCSE